MLFRVFGKFMIEKVTSYSILAAVKMFFSLSLGSVFMGIFVSFIASATLKVCHIHDPLLAAGMFILCSYISYEVSEAIHYSGIIASLFCGFGMKHYALSNISEQYQDMVLDMVHMLAQMSDLVIFFMVGENVILFAPYDNFWHIFWCCLLIIFGRMLNVFPLAGLYNLCQSTRTTTLTLSNFAPTIGDDGVASEKYVMMETDEANECVFKEVSKGHGRAPVGVVLNGALIKTSNEEEMVPNMLKSMLGYTVSDESVEKLDKLGAGEEDDVVEVTFDPKIPFADQIVMIHAGLRGAIAFALALGFPSQHKAAVIRTTTWVMLFTVFIFGGTTVPLLKGLGVKLGCPADPDELKLTDSEAFRKKCEETGKKGLSYYFLKFEARLKAILTRPPEADLGVFALLWDDLSVDEQDAAKVMGYSDDPDSGGAQWPESTHAWGEFHDMSDEMKDAALVLGLDQYHWPPPDFSAIAAANSLVTQHKSGHDDAYDEMAAKKSTQENPAYDEATDDENEATD